MEEKDLKRLTDLTIKHVQGMLTSEEQAELDAWLDCHPLNRERFERRVDEERALQALTNLGNADEMSGAVFDRVMRKILGVPEIHGRRIFRWQWFAAGAAGVLFVISALWLVLSNRSITPVSAITKKLHI